MHASRSSSDPWYPMLLLSVWKSSVFRFLQNETVEMCKVCRHWMISIAMRLSSSGEPASWRHRIGASHVFSLWRVDERCMCVCTYTRSGVEHCCHAILFSVDVFLYVMVNKAKTSASRNCLWSLSMPKLCMWTYLLWTWGTPSASEAFSCMVGIFWSESASVWFVLLTPLWTGCA